MFQLIPSVIGLNPGLTVIFDASERKHRTAELLQALNNAIPRDQTIKTVLYVDNSSYWRDAAIRFDDCYRSLEIRLYGRRMGNLSDLLTEENRLVIIETTTPGLEKLDKFIQQLRDLRSKAATSGQCFVLSVRRPWAAAMLEHADKAITIDENNHWTVIKSRGE